MSGITPTGFEAKTIEEIKASIETEVAGTLGPGLIVSADQPIGQLIAIHAKKTAEVWEALAAAYNAFDRNSSEDRLLDNIGDLTGTPRLKAQPSAVVLSLSINPGFSQAPGTLVANVLGSPDKRFTNKRQVVFPGAGGPPTIVSALFESLDLGPVQASSGAITEITNPVTGWNSVNNSTDATPGTLQEKDAAYRIRQYDELSAAGSSTVDAIRADLLKVSGVKQAFVFENTSLVVDGNGLPGKAIEAVVYDSFPPTVLNDTVAQVVWNSKPSGSETFGSVTASAIDSDGQVRSVKFSRSNVLPIYLTYYLTVDSNFNTVDGPTQLRELVVAQGNKLNLGEDVLALTLRSLVLERFGGIKGVVDVTELRLGFTASPLGVANLSVPGRSIARFDIYQVFVSI